MMILSIFMGGGYHETAVVWNSRGAVEALAGAEVGRESLAVLAVLRPCLDERGDEEQREDGEEDQEFHDGGS
jgi:hypothetical protein